MSALCAVFRMFRGKTKMPTVNWICPSCGIKSSELISEPSIVSCDNCGLVVKVFMNGVVVSQDYYTPIDPPTGEAESPEDE